MLALRLGAADAAIDKFLQAAPQADGRHLYELASAYLQSTAPDSVANAIAALNKLRSDYPKSSLARHAGSFVRQLSPRAASDSDNEQKR